MKKTQNIIMITTFVLITGCAATVYLAPEGKSIANKHNIIAILPPSVVLRSTKNMSAESVKQQQNEESKVFQQEIYTYLLKRKSKGQMVINILDVEETNVIINRNDADLSKMTTSEICELIEVDAVLSSQFSLSKPISTGAAIALALVNGMKSKFNSEFYGSSTNEVQVSLSLKDCSTKSLIWKYDHKYQGGMSSSTSTLVQGLMKNASEKMPYFKSNF